jgi:hypothetical protein
VDGLWNLIEANSAASLLWDGVDPELLRPPINMLRLAVHPGGLPSISSMTAACNAPLIQRLRRKAQDDADSSLGALVDEVESYLPEDLPAAPATQPVVTAANLAIETFLPTDEQSARRLRELAGS